MLTCSTLVRCGVDVSRDRQDTHETMQLEPHQCTHVPGNVPEHLFSTPDITGDKRQAQFISQIRVLFPLLGSFAFRLSPLSARRVQTPFTTPPVWPRRHQLCAHVFGGVSRAKGHDVGHQDDGPLHVSVTEAELSNIARTKECWLPGVHFDCKGRRWRAYWLEGQTCKISSYGVGKLDKKGMTENAASLAALRATITLRIEKVVANVQQKVHFDDSELQPWLGRKSARSQVCASTKDGTAGRRNGKTNGSRIIGTFLRRSSRRPA